MILTDKKFWNYAVDRVVKSFAQGVLAGPPLGAIFDVDWRYVAGSAISYAVLSFMTAIVAYKGTGEEAELPDAIDAEQPK